MNENKVIKISEHFTLSELTYSKTAELYGINNDLSEDKNEDKAIIDNLKSLCNDLLEPLRAMYGKPLRVSSGYRCKALNRAVGGSRTSQHCKGEAVDIDLFSKRENKKIFDLIKENFAFDQLILEHNGAWVHVSYRKDGRRQVLYT